MTLREIYCPNCGRKTCVNDEKPVCFCLECGFKIPLQAAPRPVQSVAVSPVPAGNPSTTAPKPDERIVDEKLKEVAFYYDLCREKHEAECDEPVYYLKAQDLLVDLSQQFPGDYRIWWELCKPVDFYCADSNTDIHDQYHINETYFGKALNLAGLDTKRQLIDAHDQYVAAKKKVRERYAQEQKRLADEQERLAQEELRRKQEEELQRQEAERKRQEEEKQRRLEEERRRQLQEEQAAAERARAEEIAAAERAREQELRAQRLKESESVWALLAKKDYSAIDGSYFQLRSNSGQEITCAFRVVSNVLYLMAFRVDPKKNNALYQEQTFAVEFNQQGTIVKYDKRPVTFNGNALCVTLGLESGYCVSGFELQNNPVYVTGLMKNSKKPLLPTKIFS